MLGLLEGRMGYYWRPDWRPFFYYLGEPRSYFRAEGSRCVGRRWSLHQYCRIQEMVSKQDSREIHIKEKIQGNVNHRCPTRAWIPGTPIAAEILVWAKYPEAVSVNTYLKVSARITLATPSGEKKHISMLFRRSLTPQGEGITNR